MVLFPEETDFCAAHARARIDNTGTVDELWDRPSEGESGEPG